MIRQIFGGLLSMALASSAIAADRPASRATPAEAKALLAKAVAYYQANGRTKALAEFNKSSSAFAYGDLYVFCIGPDNTLVADGGFPQFVNLSADLLKDADGKSIGRNGRDAAMKAGKSELHYRWFNPTTGLIEPKVSYFARIEQDACAVGAYDLK